MKIKGLGKEFDFELLEGEYRRYIGDEGTQEAEYLCVGVCGSNRVLYQYIDTTGDIVDYVQCVVDNIPKFALDYLINVLERNDNVLVRLVLTPGLPTSFEIYYNYNCGEDGVDNIIEWMWLNNDFEATEFRYTEIIDGHQKCVGE